MDKLQVEDSNLKLVNEWIANNQRPEFNEISGIGFVERSLWSQWDANLLENDTLY